MAQNLKQKSPLFLVVVLCSLVYFMGVNEVPFHPDESTQIFMGRDVELLFTRPSLLPYNRDNPDEIRQRYRLLDPPLSRWFIGSANLIFGISSLPADWDWGKTWEENTRLGALPSPHALLISRLAVCFVFPLLLYFSYKIGELLADRTTGWLNLILTAINGLILLHTRRAMAESLLVFFLTLSLYLFVKKKRPVWLIAIPITLAFNAKYSAAPLVLVGFIYCLMNPLNKTFPLRQRLKTIMLYSTIFVLTTFLLNPVLWSSPLDAVRAAAIERQNLMAAQTAAIGGFNPSQTPQTIAERLLALIAQLYIAPPAVADVGNYLKATELSAQIYFSRPWHNLTNGFFKGGFFLSLTIIGFFWMIRRNWRLLLDFSNPSTLFLIAFILQFAGIISGIPLAFQRYYLPLLPYITFLIAYAVSRGIDLSKNTVKPSVQT